MKAKVLVRGKSLLFLWVGLICFLGSATPAVGFSGGKIKNYSAEMVMISPDGKTISTSKLYITPEAYRMDGIPGMGAAGMLEGDMTILIFPQRNQEYVYNHDKKLVFVGTHDESGMKAMQRFDHPISERVLGKEKVSGYACTKKEVTTSNAWMGMDGTSTDIIWQSDQFDMPLRILNDEGYRTELRRIVAKKPDSKLFRPLTGYRKVDNLMAVMGMDFANMVQKMDDPKAPPAREMGDVDLEEVMARLEKIMGAEGADPEQMEVMRQIMSQAMEIGRQTDAKTGAVDPMWQIIPRRPGDVTGIELKTPDMYQATLGTQDSLEEVCRDYETRLNGQGWQNSGSHIQDGQGFLNMTRGERILTISSAADPGMEGEFRSYYHLKLYDPESGAAASAPGTSEVPGPARSEDIRNAQQTVSENLLFPNSDFEQGDLTHWTATGTAFAHQPTKGDNPTARHRNQPSNHQGEFWIGTYEKYQGISGQEPGDIQGDTPTGTLTSTEFVIAGDRIRFLVGGGKRQDSLYVALVVDGREVLRTTGNNHETMERHVWDVSEFRGQTARIVISDQSSGGWGHINVDDFRYEKP